MEISDREYLILMGEHDYCMCMLNECIKELNKTQSKAMSSPINQLIDKATSFNCIEWEIVALNIYWCEQVIERRKKLDIDFEATQMLKDGLKDFIIKCGKEDFYNKIMQSIKDN